MNEDYCYLEIKDGYLYVVLPDGKHLPGQRNLITKQGHAERGYVMATVELIVEVKK